ncbi:MAG TPA: glycosyltransferase family 1 protein [Thermoanaerobaculia bacterium]|nr:glycosyltransferase family 1 protein [Thermoanaerobaculia bacterium]
MSKAIARAPAAGRAAAALGHVARAARRLLSPRRILATAAFLGGLVSRIRRRRAEARLTVAVDINSQYETLTGVGWYLHELLLHLADRDDLRLRLYGQGLVDAPGAPRPVVPLPAGKAIEAVTYSALDGLVIPPWRAEQWLRRAAPLLVAADRNRVLFAPNYLPPPLFRLASGARVATIHDLAVRRLPWAVRPDSARALAEGLERTLVEAELLLTPSAAVRDELVAAGVAPARVRAIHHGPGQRTHPGDPPPRTPPRFGLHVGTLEPRKNVPMLLAAWRLLRRRLPGAPPLVLAGASGWHAEALRREVGQAEDEGWLVYLGYVSPAELAALYCRAAVVVVPSLYEGFGLPAVEALAAGAPLVASDIPPLREVAGDAAVYAPPERPEVWADRLAEVLSNDELRRELAGRAAARRGMFDWERAAEATARAWRDAAEAGQAG